MSLQNHPLDSLKTRKIFVTPPTTGEVLATAAKASRDHALQFWDAVVCAAADSAGAELLLTEDLQDGRRLGNLLFINPFAPENSVTIDRATSPT